MKEIWKSIKGYEGLYQVSNKGKVKSLSRKRIRVDRIFKKIANIFNIARNTVSQIKTGKNWWWLKE